MSLKDHGRLGWGGRTQFDLCATIDSPGLFGDIWLIIGVQRGKAFLRCVFALISEKF